MKDILIYFGLVIFSYLLGNIAVYLFNHIPGRWLVDYDEEPSEELLHPTTQRIKSVPYKYLFPCFFIFISFMLYKEGLAYVFVSDISVFILLLIAISDYKYKIIPDELLILFTISAVGFLPFMPNLKDMLLGLAFGFIVTILIFLISKFIFKKDGMGMGDVKLFTSLGIVSGLYGVVTIFILSTIIIAIFSVINLIRKRVKVDSTIPMAPYVCFSYVMYLVFLKNLILNINISI